MQLSYIYEKFRGESNQELQIACDPSDRSVIDDLHYTEFEVRLFIGGKYIADISDLLDKADILQSLIDGINWHEAWDAALELKAA